MVMVVEVKQLMFVCCY